MKNAPSLSRLALLCMALLASAAFAQQPAPDATQKPAAKPAPSPSSPVVLTPKASSASPRILQGVQPQVFLLDSYGRTLVVPGLRNNQVAPRIAPGAIAPQVEVRTLLFTPEDAARAQTVHPLLTPETAGRVQLLPYPESQMPQILSVQPTVTQILTVKPAVHVTPLLSVKPVIRVTPSRSAQPAR
jgi:hypothetical protein